MTTCGIPHHGPHPHRHRPPHGPRRPLPRYPARHAAAPRPEVHPGAPLPRPVALPGRTALRPAGRSVARPAGRPVARPAGRTAGEDAARQVEKGQLIPPATRPLPTSSASFGADDVNESERPRTVPAKTTRPLKAGRTDCSGPEVRPGNDPAGSTSGSTWGIAWRDQPGDQPEETAWRDRPLKGIDPGRSAQRLMRRPHRHHGPISTRQGQLVAAGPTTSRATHVGGGESFTSSARKGAHRYYCPRAATWLEPSPPPKPRQKARSRSRSRSRSRPGSGSRSGSRSRPGSGSRSGSKVQVRLRLRLRRGAGCGTLDRWA